MGSMDFTWRMKRIIAIFVFALAVLQVSAEGEPTSCDASETSPCPEELYCVILGQNQNGHCLDCKGIRKTKIELRLQRTTIKEQVQDLRNMTRSLDMTKLKGSAEEKQAMRQEMKEEKEAMREKMKELIENGRNYRKNMGSLKEHMQTCKEQRKMKTKPEGVVKKAKREAAMADRVANRAGRRSRRVMRRRPMSGTPKPQVETPPEQLIQEPEEETTYYY